MACEKKRGLSFIAQSCTFPLKKNFILFQDPKQKNNFCFEIYFSRGFYNTKSDKNPNAWTRDNKKWKNDSDPQSFQKRPFDRELTVNFLKIYDKHYLMVFSFSKGELRIVQ